jgi:hypothetical protein
MIAQQHNMIRRDSKHPAVTSTKKSNDLISLLLLFTSRKETFPCRQNEETASITYYDSMKLSNNNDSKF